MEAYLYQSQKKATTRYDQEATHPPPRPLATACMSGGSLSPKLSQACVVPIPKSPVNPSIDEVPQGKPGDSRPIPLMTSSRINRAPCVLQTDFIALK